MMEVELTQGKVAQIDDEAWPLVSQFKWHVRIDRSSDKPRFYAQTNLPRDTSGKRGKMLLHRLVMNARPGEKIDHWSGDGLDCRKENLRTSTDSQNQGNRGSFIGTSSYKGVSWNVEKQKWRAAIYNGGRTRFLGYFASEEAAAAAYDIVAREVHGEFARLNSPGAAASRPAP